MSLLDHPSWSVVAPFIQVLPYGRDTSRQKTRFRLELVGDYGLAYVLDLTDVCASCGAVIHPFRARHTRPCTVYVAVTCELAVNVACSRSRAAADEYNRIRAGLLTAAVIGGWHV